MSSAIITESNNSNQKLQVPKTADLYKKEINQIRVGEAVAMVTTLGTSGAYEGAINCKQTKTDRIRHPLEMHFASICFGLFCLSIVSTTGNSEETWQPKLLGVVHNRYLFLYLRRNNILVH